MCERDLQTREQASPYFNIVKAANNINKMSHKSIYSEGLFYQRTLHIIKKCNVNNRAFAIGLNYIYIYSKVNKENN